MEWRQINIWMSHGNSSNHDKKSGKKVLNFILLSCFCTPSDVRHLSLTLFRRKSLVVTVGKRNEPVARTGTIKNCKLQLATGVNCVALYKEILLARTGTKPKTTTFC
jgi:hypothetical protein